MHEAQFHWKEYLINNLPTWSKRDVDQIFRALWEDYLKERHQEGSILIEEVEAIIDRLKNDEPIEYVTGNAVFYGLNFMVNPDVLIPRPETEELVLLALESLNLNKPFRGLDIGTGSGCIAITLRKKCPLFIMDGLDISPAALEIAQANAYRHNTLINWHKTDFLDEQQWSGFGAYDFIISNPPYIPLSDQKVMDKKVLHYEPSQALFTPEENPLIFYEKITEFASQHLAEQGFVFVEINEFLAKETMSIFSNIFKEVHLFNDLQGKARMIKAEELI